MCHTTFKGQHYTDGDFWRKEHHGMFLLRVLKWYWGKIISPERSRGTYIIFPKYHFKPQDTRNILWCSQQQSCHLLYYYHNGSPIPIALLGFCTCRNSHSSFQRMAGRGFLVRSVMRICTVCAINSQCAVTIHFWNDSIARSFCHLFAWKFSQSENVFWYRSMLPLRSWGGEHTELWFNHVTVISQSVTRIRLSHIIFQYCMAWFTHTANIQI